jgi:hypothetical protein
MASVALPDGADGDCGNIERLQIILRSASSAKASEIVHNSFHEDVLAPTAAVLSGEDAEMRATMAMSLLTGTTIMRAIMGVDSLCECDLGDVRKELEGLLRAALFGTKQ